MFHENWITYLISLLPLSKGKILISQNIKIYIERNSEFLLLLFFLKNHTFTNMIFLNDETAADQLDSKNRFKISIILTSVYLRKQIILISYSNVLHNFLYGHDSLTSFFLSSNWLEREMWDMFGILFFGHTTLKRILTDYGFEGYPLRKDFPVTGYVELRYNEETKSLIYEPIELMQEVREFNLKNPWKI